MTKGHAKSLSFHSNSAGSRFVKGCVLKKHGSYDAALIKFFTLTIVTNGIIANYAPFKDINSPWSGKFNLQAVDIMAHRYFVLAETSRQNLLSEGNPNDQIWVTGCNSIDALVTTPRSSYANSNLIGVLGYRLMLITARCREYLGKFMRCVFRAVHRVMEGQSSANARYLIYMKPKVRTVVHSALFGFSRPRIIGSLDVIDYHNSIDRSYLVLTDSGRIQEEASSRGKLVLVIRDTTEDFGGVAMGTLKIMGADEDAIYREFSRLLSGGGECAEMSHAYSSYGDGYAGGCIADVLPGRPVFIC